MTIEQAKERLAAYRKKQRELRKKTDALRDALHKKGVDPDAPAADLTERNKAIYSRYLNGIGYAETGKEYNLSAARIVSICRRMEWMNGKKAGRE